MADNEQQMVLVAKLVDQVSDKLKEINKAMLATESAAKKAHHGAPRAPRSTASKSSCSKSLSSSSRKPRTELIKPGFAALGVSAFSLAGAIGAVVEAVKGSRRAGLALEKVRIRTGMMADSIRQMQGLGERWGISIDADQ
jgi:hypothetical protein